MKASVGDRLVIASNRVDQPLRDGEIVECRHEDGSPPYLVRWSDTGQTALFFPGPNAYVQHFTELEEKTDQGGGAEAAPRHIKTWRVQVDVFESGDDTTAHAVLVAEVPGIEARGATHRNPHDESVPEIGDEVAVARALRGLSERLLEVASDDISGIQGEPVALDR